MRLNYLKARATSRRQSTFYHLSQPWSHPVVLNTGTLDWESSTLTTRPLLYAMGALTTKFGYKKKFNNGFILHICCCCEYLISLLYDLLKWSGRLVQPPVAAQLDLRSQPCHEFLSYLWFDNCPIKHSDQHRVSQIVPLTVPLCWLLDGQVTH